MFYEKERVFIGLALAVGGGLALAQTQEAVPAAFDKGLTAGPSSTAPATAATADASDPFDPDIHLPHLIRVQVEWIELSHEALTKLMLLADAQSTDATPLRKQVQEMVVKDDAKVLETQMLVALPGQKATIQSIHELIYPTEFEPLQMEKKADDPAKPGAISPPTCCPSTPSAWETRNLGSTLEIEPSLADDNRIIDLRFVPELVWHTGNTVWHEGKDRAGNPFKIQMPDMYTLRVNTAISCVAGHYALVSAQTPKDAKGDADLTRKVMVFVKCDILTVK